MFFHHNRQPTENSIVTAVLSAPDPEEKTTAIWYESAGVCALADTERHLGHAIQDEDGWVAYNATHLNGRSDGFLVVGQFESLTVAKLAIEASVGICGHWWRLDPQRHLF
jgi:hypothetical protein